MRDRYTFANSDAGRKLRQQTADSLRSQQIESEMGEEVMTGIDYTCNLLTLTVTSKRLGEGQIAKDIKARKSTSTKV